MTQRSMKPVESLVIKVGSGVLVRDGVRFDRGTFCRLVETLAALVEKGYKLTLVSSGAVALGRGKLHEAKPDRRKSLPKLQALAAVGQTTLMQLYDSEFAHYGLHCGQILLTREDTDNRTRYLNARRTLRTLWALGTVPIINENDSIATEEIRLGDNDMLAARVACMLAADLLVIFSDVDAVYSSNPKTDPAAQRFDMIAAMDPRLDAVAAPSQDKKGVGTGGMFTKLEAARVAARRGIPSLIMSGKQPNRLVDALSGDEVGTLLLAQDSPQSSRKVWIDSLKLHGRLYCDEGAVMAVIVHGKSLLPSGVSKVEGRFDEGDAIELCDPAGNVFGRGLALYPAADLRQIAGEQSSRIEDVLGYHVSDAVVHRDDMVFSNPPSE
ncbi:MAG: glutamate 5-kinase [Myxococcota bacterium]|jgi:glutamate 5-kinase|nr:glutamate 5-kinase [Myxococcota bacterium]